MEGAQGQCSALTVRRANAYQAIVVSAELLTFWMGRNIACHWILNYVQAESMQTLNRKILAAIWTVLVTFCGGLQAEGRAPSIKSYVGKTPQIDGVLSAGEWSDATRIDGVRDWVAQFSPVTNNEDLSLKGFIKHDAQWLYLAFEVTDETLYGIDTERWLPDENPRAHELTREGFPWFGDEIEVLINAAHRWKGNEEAEGNGSSWQMVCNLIKSRLGGIGAGGLLEGEPRTNPQAWKTYQHWILSGVQKAAVRKKPEGKGYFMEWAIRFNPCLEIAPGKFYSPALGKVPVGLNIALGDLDRKETGKGNFGNFHHEQWWAGVKDLRTQKQYWGTLWLMGKERKAEGPPVP